jgi:C-methyltransferase.
MDFIVEDNKLKQGKFVPGVKIPIVNKKRILDKNNNMIVLAWNFYQDIKNNNKDLSNNFVNIKDLEN